MEGTLNMSCTGYLKKSQKRDSQDYRVDTIESRKTGSQFNLTDSGIKTVEKSKGSKLRVLRIIRIAAIVLLLALAFGKMAAHAGSQKITYTQDEYVYKIVTVKEGDSLWTIGKEFNGSTADDIREWIDNVKEMNQLHGDTIRSGQKLLIYCGQSMEDAVH